MSAIHVIVRPENRAAQVSLAPIYALFDVVVDGVNLTARIGESQSLALLSELGHVVAAIAVGRRSRGTLQLYSGEQAWELGIEADGCEALLSIYRAGHAPSVAVFERRVPLADLLSAVSSALDAVLTGAPERHRKAFTAARQALAIGLAKGQAKALPRKLTSSSISSPERAPIKLSATAAFRTRQGSELPDAQLERADLHSLLLKGDLRLQASGRETAFSNVQLYITAENLLLLAEEVLDAWQGGRALFRRAEIEGVRLSLRCAPAEAQLALTFGPVTGEGRVTFPAISCVSFVRAVTAFCQQLADAFCRHDPEQRRNLRLATFLTTLRALNERLEDALAEDTRTNLEPASYQSFGLPQSPAEHAGCWAQGAKMRFIPRWVATVPGIDLRSTFLCGDRLVVGSTRELACIHRQQGDVLWRVPAARAGSVITPNGLARIHQDGRIQLHELEAGEVRYTVKLAPRAGGGASGALVHAPGLPRLLVVAEGDRKVTAIELTSGEIRWRHTARCPSQHRMRRAGKLLLVAGGDSSFTALDVLSGELVWRVRDRCRFSGEVAVDHDSAFALSGTQSGVARLHHLNLWSGEQRWIEEIDDRPIPGQAPLLTPSHVVVPTRDRRGVGLCAFERASGKLAWHHEPGLSALTSAWLAVDEMIVANSAAGTLLGIDAITGAVRFNHVFPRQVEADQPRRLEPVLRSGALFVPQHQVHVVRPSDGEIIGSLPSDLIPDLLRVDERCDVYIAEESGHLAAFGAAPRLTLVS